MGYVPNLPDINAKYVCPLKPVTTKLVEKEDVSVAVSSADRESKEKAVRTMMRTTVMKTTMMLLPLSRKIYKLFWAYTEREEVLGQLRWAPGHPFLFFGYT